MSPIKERALKAPRFVSVIIPVRNASATIDLQLAALSRQTFRGDWEVVVADNGSSDETQAMVLAWAGKIPQLQLVDAADRVGPNHARNVGTAKARGDFLLFCDADEEASPEWVAGMARAASEYDLVGGALDVEKLNDPFICGWVETAQWTHLPKVLDFLPYSLSANFGIWGDTMAALGGWNVDFDRPGGDDVDLCWRAQLNSYSLGFAPEAVVHYRYRTSMKALAKQHFGYGAAEPRLYKTFKESGFRREPPRTVVGIYVRILKDIPYLFTRPQMRGIWVRKVAHTLGRIVGSIKNRVIFL